MAGGGIYQAQAGQYIPYHDRTPTYDISNAKGIGEFFSGLQNQDIKRILEGVKAGLIDPNEALVQGTPGGSAFEKYFGVKPPSAPSPEMVDTTAFPAGNYDEQTLGEPLPFDPERTGPGKGVPISVPTGKIKGGFQPQNATALKDWVARELGAGREVSPQLMQAAGFQPKTLAALAATDPEAAKRLQKLKNEPAKLRAFNQLKIAFPDASEDDIAKFVTGAEEGVMPNTPANLGKSATQQKTESISDFKNKDLNFRIQKSAEYIRTRDRKLDIDEQKFALENTGRALDRLSKHVGFDYAKDIVAALAEGKTLDEIPLPDEVKKRVNAEFNRKQQTADAKTTSANASMLRAQTMATIAPEKLAQDADRYNKMFEIQTNGQNLRDMNNYVKNNLSVAFKLMQNPATNAEGQRVLKDIAENQLGWDTGDPEGFQGIKEFVGRLFGSPGWGTQSITPTKGPADVSPSVRPSPREAPKLGNTPRVVPNKPNAAKPKTAADFLAKWPSAPGIIQTPANR